MHQLRPADHSPDDDRAMVVTATSDGLTHLLALMIDLIISIRVVDCEQPVDVYLEAVTVTVTVNGDRHQLRCRHVDERCNPIGPSWTIGADEVAHLHIW